MDDSRPAHERPALEDRVRDARAELAGIERELASGLIEASTALALAFCAGVEHARRLLAT